MISYSTCALLGAFRSQVCVLLLYKVLIIKRTLPISPLKVWWGALLIC